MKFIYKEIVIVNLIYGQIFFYFIPTKKVSKIKDSIVGSTRFFLLYKKMAMLIERTASLIKSVESNKAPAGNIIILVIRAANME
tara:strand:- start:55 stop:306 length:252 start_codon:yes stop_codon:yes gene_type:complete